MLNWKDQEFQNRLPKWFQSCMERTRRIVVENQMQASLVTFATILESAWNERGRWVPDLKEAVVVRPQSVKRHFQLLLPKKGSSNHRTNKANAVKLFEERIYPTLCEDLKKMYCAFKKKDDIADCAMMAWYFFGKA